MQLDLHVTEGKHNKATLRQVLYQDDELRPIFEGLAHVLGYSDPFGLSQDSAKKERTARQRRSFIVDNDS